MRPFRPDAWHIKQALQRDQPVSAWTYRRPGTLQVAHQALRSVATGQSPGSEPGAVREASPKWDSCSP
jgi:hypothetical protein